VEVIEPGKEASQTNWLCRAGRGPVRALTGANLPTIRLEPHANRKQKQLTLSTLPLGWEKTPRAGVV